MSVIAFKEIGSIEKQREEAEIEWKITDFSSVAKNENCIASPTFSFVGIRWCLQLKKARAKPGFICLFLVKQGHCICPVEYNFCLKKLDGCVEYSSTEIFHENCLWSNPNYIKLLHVEQQKSEQDPSGVFIIRCMLKRKTTHSNQSDLLHFPELKKKKLIDLDTLSDNFLNLLTNKESCDTTLYVMHKVYKAHKAVLAARSSVFAAMFLHETSEKQTGIVTISDCDPETFGDFLEFLYSGKLEKPSFQNALHLYKTSDKYEVLKLKVFCSEFLSENLTEENLCDIVILADTYDDEELLSAAQDFFNKNFGKILVKPEWDTLLKTNRHLANKLLIEMSSKMNIMRMHPNNSFIYV